MYFALVPSGDAPDPSSRKKLSLEWHNTQAHQVLEDLRALNLGKHFNLMCKTLRVPVDASLQDGPALEVQAMWKPLHRRRVKEEEPKKEPKPKEEPKEESDESQRASRGTKRPLDGPQVEPRAFRRSRKLPFMTARV